MIGLLVYTIIEAPRPRLGKPADAGRLRRSPPCCWRRRSLPASGARRTRCSISACSATPGSPPPARRSRSRSSPSRASSSSSPSISSSSSVTGRSPPACAISAPVASSVAISSILGARLAVQNRHEAGRRVWAVPQLGGLLPPAGSRPQRSGPATRRSRPRWFVLGTGMGLTSAPATEALMGVVPTARAGVGSAVNDATRLLGGTLGVAVIGSVYASLYAGRLHERAPDGVAGRLLARTAHTSSRRRRSPWPASSGPCRPSGYSRRLCTAPPAPPSSRRLPRGQLRLGRREKRRRRRRVGVGAALPPSPPSAGR